ncbi:hypothetical protein ACOI1C_05955 [Bacillus sp. DJP31]
MRQLDWQLLCFISASVIQDLWLYVGMPQIYYWEVKSQIEDDNRKSA